MNETASKPLSQRARIWWTTAVILIVITYGLPVAVAFSTNAVTLVFIIPAALGCLALGILIWGIAVIKDARRQGML